MPRTKQKPVNLNEIKFDNKLTIDIAEVCRQIFDDDFHKEQKDDTEDMSSDGFSFISLGSDFTISDVEDEDEDENIVVEKPNANTMDALLAAAGLAVKRRTLPRRSNSGITIGAGKSAAAESLKKMSRVGSEVNLKGGLKEQKTSGLRRQVSSDTLASLQARIGSAGSAFQKVSSHPNLAGMTKNDGGAKKVNIKPQDHLMALMREEGVGALVLPHGSVDKDFFLEITMEQIAAFQQDLVSAVRKDDIDTIRKMFRSGRSLQACNVHGESIIHLVCRRGSAKMLRFLMTEVGLSVNVCCENGRSALHDACWNGSPDFEKINLLLVDHPDLLYVTDKRGFTPLNYVPQTCWMAWKKFLDENRALIRPRQLLGRRSHSR